MPHGELPLFYTLNFYIFGIVAVVAALLFVTRKSPVAAAMWLVTTMFALAALFVMLDAQFRPFSHLMPAFAFCSAALLERRCD